MDNVELALLFDFYGDLLPEKESAVILNTMRIFRWRRSPNTAVYRVRACGTTSDMLRKH